MEDYTNKTQYGNPNSAVYSEAEMSNTYYRGRSTSSVKSCCSFLARPFVFLYERFTSFCAYINRRIRIMRSAPYVYCEGEKSSGKGLNYDFYTNKVAVLIGGQYLTFSAVLNYLDRNYIQLEKTHNYVQWLFPMYTQGMSSAVPLTKKESAYLRDSTKAVRHFEAALDIMLHFWGMKVDKNPNDGSISIKKSDNWIHGTRNLATNSHNFLRINRVLQSLECFGLSEYQAPLLKFLMDEIMVNDIMLKDELAVAKKSLCRHWLKSISDPNEQHFLTQMCKNKGLYVQPSKPKNRGRRR